MAGAFAIWVMSQPPIAFWIPALVNRPAGVPFGAWDMYLDFMKVRDEKQYWRLFSAFMFPGFSFLQIFTTLFGLHVGTWFTLNAFEGRHEIMIVQANIMWFFVLGYALVVDDVNFQLPFTPFAVGMVFNAWRVCKKVEYVHPLIFSMTIIWGFTEIFCHGVYVVLIGLIIGFIQSFMVNELPQIAGIDLLKAPVFLTTICDKFLNDSTGPSEPLLTRNKQKVNGPAQDIYQEDVEAKRLRNLDALKRRHTHLNQQAEDAERIKQEGEGVDTFYN